MNILKSFSLLVIALVGYSVSSANTHFSQEAPALEDYHFLKEVLNPARDIPKEQAQQIIAAYLEVKNALVQTDGTSARAAAAQLVEKLGDSEDALIEKIRADAKQIAATEDPEVQREQFNSLSDTVYELIKATGANDSPLYLQYCPMALGNSGAYWLAAEKEVNNPYFGDMMLHCGSVEKEL